MARERSAERPWWVVPAIVYGATIALFLAWSPSNRAQFPLDDAWIHRVYARSFAWGHGFAYNDAQEAGCTSPLWAVISAPAQWLEPPFGPAAVVWAVKLLGVALGALSVAGVYRLGRQMLALSTSGPAVDPTIDPTIDAATGATGRTWPAALAASLFACEPALAFSTLSGMEVALLLCLWLWVLASIHAGRWRRAAVLLGLLPVARPEGVLLAGLCVLALVIQRRRKVMELVTPATVIAAALPTALWIAFCELVTGHLLPNTFYLKASSEVGAHAIATAFGALVQHGWARSIALPIAGALALALWCHRNRRHAAVAALLALGSLAFVIAVVGTRSYLPLGYYWTRWTDPGVLGVAAACALGIALAMHALARAIGALDARVARAAIARLTLVIVALVLIVVASVPGLARSLAERAERLGSDGRVIERMNVEPGRWIAAHTPPSAVVGVNDAGALRYFGQRTTIDLIGLNSADLAFQRVPMDAIEQRIDWLAVYPLLLNLHPVFASFAQLRWFAIPREQYTICDCRGPTEMFVARRPDGGALGAEQRQAIRAALRRQPAGTMAWLVASSREPSSAARAEELRGLFVEAGWQVPELARVAVQPPPGLALLVAGDEPPPTAAAVLAALEAAGLDVELHTGYRAVLAQHRAASPQAPAIDLAADQPFVLVVGRPDTAPRARPVP